MLCVMYQSSNEVPTSYELAMLARVVVATHDAIASWVCAHSRPMAHEAQLLADGVFAWDIGSASLIDGSKLVLHSVVSSVECFQLWVDEFLTTCGTE